MPSEASSIDLHAVHRRIDDHEKRLSILEADAASSKEQRATMQTTLNSLGDGMGRVERKLTAHIIDEAKDKNKVLVVAVMTLLTALGGLAAILITYFLSR